MIDIANRDACKSSPSIGLLISLMRPRTLPAAVCPVIVATTYAYQVGSPYLWDAVLCILVAIGAQIASNVANDYFDYKHGADTDARVGPSRPLSRGLVSQTVVLVVLCAALVVTVSAGLLLSFRHSWWLIGIGLAVCLGLMAYSAGPFPLSYLGLGDVAVLIFFGLVPTVFSGYVLGVPFGDSTLWYMALAIGLANVCILVANNYRDYDEDKRTGKRTSIVRFGKIFGRILYLFCGLVATLLIIASRIAPLSFGLLVPYMSFHFLNYHYLRTHSGSSLNQLLSRSALAVILLTLTIVTLLLRP